MNWGAVGTLVSIAGIAFATGSWVNKLGKEVEDLSREIESIKASLPILKSKADVKTLGDTVEAFNKKVSSLEAQIQSTIKINKETISDKLPRSEFIAFQDRLGNWGNGDADAVAINKGASGTVKTLCPRGYYAIGLTVHDEDGGGYAVSAINGVTLHCKPLNK